AFGNKMNGFDENGSNGGVSKLTLYNNTAYNNGIYNFYFDAAAGHVFRNNISYGTGKLKTTGTADHNSWDAGVSLSSAD
ncbi:hypothetical protein KBI52_00050, partial [Microvirga sp. HBU67558]|nr:hypothetical protein [Microvirga sp. HBU67558]